MSKVSDLFGLQQNELLVTQDNKIVLVVSDELRWDKQMQPMVEVYYLNWFESIFTRLFHKLFKLPLTHVEARDATEFGLKLMQAIDNESEEFSMQDELKE